MSAWPSASTATTSAPRCPARLGELAGGLARLSRAFEVFLCTPDGARPLGQAAPDASAAAFEPYGKTTREGLRRAGPWTRALSTSCT